MAHKANILLLKKIDSMNIDDNTKEILKNIIYSEIQKGDSPEVKKYKVTTCLEIIARGRRNEDI